jgi:hypothetical protein
VSEERGQIALSIDGGLERDLTQDQLRERLQALLAARRSGKARDAAPIYDY